MTVGFAVLLVQLSVLAWTTFWLATQTKDGLRWTAVVMHKMNVTNELERARAEMRTALRGEIVYTFANVPSEVEASHSSFLQNADQLDKSLKERKSLPLTDRGKQLTGQMEADLSQWRSKEEEVYRLCRNSQPLDATTLAKNDIRPLTDDIAAALAEVRVIQSKQLQSADQSTESRANLSSWLSLVFIVSGIVVLFTSLRLVRTIGGTLRHLSRGLQEGTGQVSQAAAQTFSSSQALAQGAAQQAASLAGC